jgi:hypothetical protein
MEMDLCQPKSSKFQAQLEGEREKSKTLKDTAALVRKRYTDVNVKNLLKLLKLLGNFLIFTA